MESTSNDLYQDGEDSLEDDDWMDTAEDTMESNEVH